MKIRSNKSTMDLGIQSLLLHFHKQEASIRQVMGLVRTRNSSYLLVLFISFSCFEFRCAIDTITAHQFIKDPEIIISNGGDFKLGFFSPTNSTYRYVGIWYAKVSASHVVWVANRDRPLKTSSGILNISEDGNLVILDEEKKIIWSSNVTNSVSNPSAQLSDSGNLVLKENNTGSILWESFQHPSDSLLPKMKMITDTITGKNVQLTSWKRPSDPSVGAFFADKKGELKVIITVTVVIGSVFIAICTFFLYQWMAKRKGGIYLKFHGEGNYLAVSMNKDKLEELPILSHEELASATNNFDQSNKLGQGGFGPVYWGKLLDGQEIAVKRLARTSGQGLEEFMNEVVVISKLQHRNLVRLIGGCVEGEEKMLVYEYMPNKSLDTFLFDPVKRESLKWRERFNIIEGIGRGLLYLHRDSRLRIIHRDLKASNILLDEELNPKISDFGLAKIFGGDEDQANTKRVAGTYGYMSPEYAMEGRFSEKSDVFSFGVLLLEIVSGRRNASFYYNEQITSLLGFAWKMWETDNIAVLIDPVISEPCSKMEILRCIHVGLLCVQDFAKDRPSVHVAISMLKSEIIELPRPKQPVFTTIQVAPETECSNRIRIAGSVNNVTITTLYGR
ncbi:G-type lectin S-receptor-like serine/threonine-protein kinase SD1-13 isoform X5 [Carya illinoinensis]|uniref:G-type lectin S-receptor-like serine/threonine-protein kinase SD1-13 isoform X5 n=1 Tax=Carya illinoinensis TaxID=32201 RepID=UPI001C71FB4D|nr:G-type lectin S-receptor-like serine/threonine-protein kinase SD1-13 isoform X5 [Carya illinoinensis]